MASSELTPTRKFLLFLLPAATLVLWKIGSPSSPTPPANPSASNAAAEGDSKDKKCCDKPPSKAALIKDTPPAPPSYLPDQPAPPAAN